MSCGGGVEYQAYDPSVTGVGYKSQTCLALISESLISRTCNSESSDWSEVCMTGTSICDRNLFPEVNVRRVTVIRLFEREAFLPK